jgi:uncharacterized DUF497 family protein
LVSAAFFNDLSMIASIYTSRERFSFRIISLRAINAFLDTLDRRL